MRPKLICTPEEITSLLPQEINLTDEGIKHIKDFCETFFSKVEIWPESEDKITIKFSIYIKESKILNAFFDDPELRTYPREIFEKDYLRILEDLWLTIMKRNLLNRAYFFPLSHQYLMKSSLIDPKKLLVLFKMELEDAKRKVQI